MADGDSPGTIRNVTGTAAVRRIQPRRERGARRQQEEDNPPQKERDEGTASDRKGRYIDEHC